MLKSYSTTFRRLWRLIRGIFVSEIRFQAYGLVLLLVLFALAIAGINVTISFINRDLFNALALKDQTKFFEKLFLLLGSFCLATPVAVLYAYTEQRFALLWRKWLSRDILKKYFQESAFYRISWHEGIDNPDQRIEEDIRSLTTGLISLFIILVNSLLTLIMFVSILWSITHQLLIAVVVYTILGSILTFLIGRKLITLNFTQLKKEADYRYKLVNIRDNAEQIAFYHGAKKEYVRARQRLKDSLSNFLKIINLNLQLGLFVNIYNYLKPVIPIVIVTPLYMRGTIEFGQITQSADAFVRVVEALSVMIQHFGTISTIAAVVTRLGSFSETLDLASEETHCHFPRIQTNYNSHIEFKNLTITTPAGDQTLVKDLNLFHEEGGLLITGASGQGKTSILRVVGGLWIFGEGEIMRPQDEDTMFIPQRPYLILGSLRNQLLYGNKKLAYTNEELKDVLIQVGLKNLLKRIKGFDKTYDWANLLSAGEQQQLAFARFSLRRPKYAFLDEATTSVDSKTEELLYELVKTTCKYWISVGYKANIGKFHNRNLNLNPDGSYEITDL
ncbi:MAG TPA: ABC transporter ATP-binding protein/permease [Oligoflexia bacterium]|nr:ABC transporter ATP-binding protein/permease [Oligoflexia bacterium]HMP49443.1 ABC transporter ATP-binding protein/permease [Oligoflexia bacterium]